jgi:pyruvate/2-oxoglutarate dehydrogenase complex dihydrolipoamide acyltransferase (E2) component
MVQEVRLPRLGKAMSQATVVSLKVALNQSVEKGQILCELETDKATLELESPAAGMIRHIFCIPEQTLPVETPLFVLADADEAVPANLLKSLQNEFSLLHDSIGHQAAGTPLQAGAEIKWPQPKRTANGNGKKIPLTRRQRIIADKMLASKQNIPCFYLNIRVDVTEVTGLLDTLNKSSAGKYSVNDFIMLALAAGLKHYPVMTGRLGEDCIILAPTIDIGLVVSAQEGPIVPVVKDVGSKTLEQISACRHEMVERARHNTLTPDDLADACITVSNLGMAGVDSFIPIVVPGQCCILGVGRIFDMPVPSGKHDIVIRSMMNLNLSVDHRTANGADAAQFLDFVKKQLEHPAGLIHEPVVTPPSKN